ncbi:hypothetical protein BDV25DRAFT_1021 [Aspergillus avenaceus]|uniref:S-adenosyl-L-methionine-dependent methyltransferase n=1 Tax=Aspergillus avenaceus TaxID=36643 RepID=A0A5N6UAY3_ASPAV|nr:hypothetical protein BDV25DRAFT_1021 [Aspergillus avenaceus]
MMEIAPLAQQLSDTPDAFPDCCLAISRPFLDYLASILPGPPGVTVSIGSGSGLLEALLAHCHTDRTVEGVEVNSTVNRYLSERDLNVVGGTWDLHPRVASATAWMFVYPREPTLVRKYLDTYSDGAIATVVWLGPRADWPDYEPCFRHSTFTDLELPEDVGLAPYEMVAVLRRSR